jgi:hypothetical protein
MQTGVPHGALCLYLMLRAVWSICKVAIIDVSTAGRHFSELRGQGETEGRSCAHMHRHIDVLPA